MGFFDDFGDFFSGLSHSNSWAPGSDIPPWLQAAGIGGLGIGGAALAGPALGLGAAGAGAGAEAATAGAGDLGALFGADGSFGGLGGAGLAADTGGAAALGGVGADLGAEAMSVDSLLPAGATPTAGTGGVQAIGGVQSSGVPGMESAQAWMNPGGSAPGAIPSAGPSAAGTAGPAGSAGGLDLTSLVKNWGGPLAGAAGLGYTILNGQKSLPSTQAIQGQLTDIKNQQASLNLPGQAQNVINAGNANADRLTAQGQPLVQQGTEYSKYLASGTLPPALQTQLDQSVQGAKVAIVSRYASQGMPTDPLKNSTLQAELAAVDQKAKVEAGQLAQQLLQSGSGLTSAGGNLEIAGGQAANSAASTASGMLQTGAQMTGMENSLLQTLSGIDQTQSQNMGKAIAAFAASLAPTKGLSLKLA